MELLSTLLSGFLTLIMFLSLKLHQYLKRSNANLPPGTTGWPFSGETLEFLSTGRKGTPETFFTDRMNRHSPEVFKTSLLAEKTAVLCGAAGNKFIFSNENKLVKSWWPLNVEKIFPNKTSTSEESDKMRKLFPGIANPNALRKYVGIMDAIAKQHLGAHWDSEGADVTVLPLAKNFTFAVACRLFLSIEDPSHVARFEKPFHLLHAGMISLPINLPGTPINRAIRASNSIRKEVLEIIEQRKQCRRREGTALAAHRDILDHLLEATDEDVRLTPEPDDIANKIMAFLLGGHDTTSSVITFIIKYLAELPEIYDNVFKEQREISEGKEEGELLNWDDLQKMKYTWNVACEVLRLAPPIHGTFREAITDFTYAGFSIPKGWKLYWTVHSTHKNPNYFEEPDKFKPSRFEGKGPIPYSYVPFGGGPRMCPGQEYAKLKILVLMHNLVANFKWEKVLPNEKIVFDPLPRPEFGLPLRMRRHSSLS